MGRALTISPHGTAVEVLNPAFVPKSDFEKGESLRAEGNRLVSRSEHVELRSTIGGLFGDSRGHSSARSLCLRKTLHAMRAMTTMFCSLEHPGDIMLCNLDGTVSTSLYLMSGSLAAEHGVRVETTAQLILKKHSLALDCSFSTPVVWVLSPYTALDAR